MMNPIESWKTFKTLQTIWGADILRQDDLQKILKHLKYDCDFTHFTYNLAAKVTDCIRTQIGVVKNLILNALAIFRELKEYIKNFVEDKKSVERSNRAGNASHVMTLMLKD